MSKNHMKGIDEAANGGFEKIDTVVAETEVSEKVITHIETDGDDPELDKTEIALSGIDDFHSTPEVKKNAQIVDAQFLTQLREQLGQLKSAVRGIDADPDVWIPTKEGDSIEGMFVGFKTFTNREGKEYDVTCLSCLRPTVDGDGVISDELRLMAISGAVAVKKCQDFSFQQPLEVIYRGKAKTTKGNNVNLYDVIPLYFS